ncbi:MAG: pyridoxamine 5'-phosphate oxidase family protein [Rhodospirillaceae bacterium]|nr:pyridoxamine 5'-phosphate oxidase family protein [Rhodospirillaceae bacterium]
MASPHDISPAPLPGWAGPASPYHPGEQAVQRRAGSRERAERGGRRMIRDAMPDQHRALFEQLPYIVLGGLDRRDRPWASILTGAPGFVNAPDPRHLAIVALPAPGEPLAEALVPGAPVGLLGIELATRRRNRANGIVAARAEAGFAVAIRQSFGNCPQYIQARIPGPDRTDAPGHRRRVSGAEGARLSAAARALIAGADTFFIASASAAPRGGDPVEGVDVSHRGGKPGFVRMDDTAEGTALTVPDFAGNAMFNTLGNIAANPQAGLLFLDFATGAALALTGRAEIVWDGPEVAAFAGAERLLRFRPAEGVWIDAVVARGWSMPIAAPQLAATGAWPQP